MLDAINQIGSVFWQFWALAASGLCGGLLTFMAGRRLLNLRRHAGPANLAVDQPDHDPFERGSLAEKRGAPRRKGNVVEVLVSDAAGVEEPLRGLVLDRSMDGLRVLLANEVSVGTVLSVKVRNGPPATPWIQVQVRGCKPDRSGYETHCKFVRTPPWSVLLHFG
jgi:hypothetical protein